ncbi:MAG: hypothetical protein KJP15_00810, partial [Gammaproteobacteria bacterium]|nr:hypothetical protein [Gammaproteobacteria bacterium]
AAAIWDVYSHKPTSESKTISFFIRGIIQVFDVFPRDFNLRWLIGVSTLGQFGNDATTNSSMPARYLYKAVILSMGSKSIGSL